MIKRICDQHQLIKLTGGPRVWYLHNTNLNTLSTQTPSSQELLGHIKKEWQIKMMALCFSFSHRHRHIHSHYITSSYSQPPNIITQEKVFFNFTRNSKLAHILKPRVFFLALNMNCFFARIKFIFGYYELYLAQNTPHIINITPSQATQYSSSTLWMGAQGTLDQKRPCYF